MIYSVNELISYALVQKKQRLPYTGPHNLLLNTNHTSCTHKVRMSEKTPLKQSNGLQKWDKEFVMVLSFKLDYPLVNF